ncbi:DNA cytosine methyltransferase [Marinobacter sp. ELB17]|uniref:DNA cytosine methyltransferase n=1 Tax=Marinobacter sp. ELB17 TaxID=270374 RepID=UPI0000F39A3C|nr:DNA cytosine methyltransferase [Marinobacter sp. ELB17]EAZ97556.1 C-5 cytosine-specific DNA methylase [Marinobacter sp. ELB17]
MNSITAIDLFCGAGGLTHGLIKAGVNVIAGVDVQKSCKYAYEKNNYGAEFVNMDVRELTGMELNALYPKKSVRLLAGCAPCQPFSTYSQGRDVKNDKKWPLLYAFSRLIGEVLPELVTMENVPDVTKHEVYHDFVGHLGSLGYRVWAQKIYCPNYGIPQSRNRHVLLASRLGDIKILEPIRKPKKYRTVRQTIGNLPSLRAGEQCLKDRLHISAGLSSINLTRIKHSKPGGTWRDWPESLMAECHRKATGKTYVSVYARMSWDKVSPTITTQSYGFGNGRFGHPDQDRAISLREAAMLQTFPKSYQFIPPNEKVQLAPIGTMIGNAVPVNLGKVIGRSFQQHIKSMK